MTLPETLATKALSLYEREHELLNLIEIEEELSPEQETQLQDALAESLQYAVEKRESFGLFMLWLDQQTGTAKREIERLRLRVDRIDALRQRLKRYGVAAIRALGTDHQGKFRKLVGHTITLFIRALPSSVEITDEAAIPNEFKRVSVQMPAQLYERLCTLAPIMAELPLKDVAIDKEAIKRALESNRDVPGADLRLSGHDHTLVVR